MVGIVFAALAGLLLLGRGETAVPAGGAMPSGPGPTAATTASRAMEPTVYVEFLLEAPGASSVAVGGDFDGWEGSYPLSDPDGDGIWSGRVPVKPGVHAYMFLVDGSNWMTDPQAERYAEDGFGNRNAILAVTAPAA
jgi:1,4-alpha-glucan branching enzyme